MIGWIAVDVYKRQVEGQQYLFDGKADELSGIVVVDDLHFEIHMSEVYTPLTLSLIHIWGTVNVKPYQWMPLPASMLADEIIKPTVAFLNMDLSLIHISPDNPENSGGRAAVCHQ